MNKLKASMLAVLMAVGALGSPQKADAGVILVGSGGTALVIVGAAAMAAGAAGAITVGFAPGVSWFDPPALGLGLGVGLFILDTNASSSADQLAQIFSARYSFIENPAVIKSLVNVIQKKAASVEEINGQRFVSLTRNEVMNLLRPVDLSGKTEQVEKMVQDLN